jgi:arylsulfatase
MACSTKLTYFNLVPETVEDQLKHYDEWGGPTTYPHMAAGWAVAGDTPFAWTKQVPSNYGGTRNGMIVSWPGHVSTTDKVRSQWHHVIDVEPTVLEATHLPQPKTVNGIVQEPIEGVSMMYTFEHPEADTIHKTQYFEIFGNRAIYNDGWFAGTIHKAPWETQPRAKLKDDKWELYDTSNDFSLSNDVAASNPAKLKDMQALFLSEATKYRALPIDDRSFERGNPEAVGRPDLMGNRTSLSLSSGMTGMTDNVFINVRNRSFSITAAVDIPSGGAKGVILAQGGRWSLYLNDGKPTYYYNFLGLEQYRVASPEVLSQGKSTIRVEFVYDGGGVGKGGTATLLVNDARKASGRIERTQPTGFSFDETAGVGIDESTPVSDEYEERANSFTGTIEKVVVDVEPMSVGQAK